MTISKIAHIQSVGRFKDCTATGDVTFKKFNLLFGENGRGKTTLCAILRSFLLQSPDIVVGRRTLGSNTDSRVVLQLGGGRAMLSDGAWSGVTIPMRIFDSQYVAENVYSGDAVSMDQRRNLCRIILGRDGVLLAQRYDEIDGRIEALNREIREVRNQIQVHAGRMSVDDFLALGADPDIDAKVAEKEREVEGLRELGRLRTKSGLSKLDLPPIPRLFAGHLATTLDDVSRDAEQIMREHLSVHGMTEGGEEWLSRGHSYGDADSCPYCGQGTQDLPLIHAYQATFSAAYQTLRRNLTAYRAQTEKVYGDERIQILQTALQANNSNLEVWSRYVRFAAPTLSFDSVPESIRALRHAILNLLERKLVALLDVIPLSDDYSSALLAVSAFVSAGEAYNSAVEVANAAIDAFKASANSGRLQAAENELARLRLVKKRHEAAVVELCDRYAQRLVTKAGLDTEKQETRRMLDQHGATVMSRYQRAINTYLRRFGAGFAIDRSRIDYRGRTPNSTYCLVINETVVELGAEDTPVDQPSFKNTLSAGDRSTLALAFFLAEIDEDPEKATCTVVFDDPFNSQDHFRRTCTISEIKRCGEAVAQVVVMSHDRRFLHDIWGFPLPTDQRKALQLTRYGQRHSVITEWDIDSDSESEDATNRRSLIAFYSRNQGQPRDVIQKIRPVVETHMRRLGGPQLDGVQGLGNMIQRIRDSGTPQPLVDVLPDCEGLNTYTRRYMHGENPNAASERVSDEELHNFVRQTLELVGANIA